MERVNTDAGHFAFRRSRPDDQAVRVLVADEDHFYLKHAQRVLTSLGCKVTVFDSGKFAWLELLRRRGKFDIVMVDVYIPVMNGFEILDKIKEKWMDLPVVNTNPVIIKRATQQNASFYVAKSAAMNALTNFRNYVNWNRKAREMNTEESDNYSDPGEWHENHLTPRKGKNNNEQVTSGIKKDESAQKRKQCLDWHAALRNKFFSAINVLGFEKAVPSSILELMNVPGIRRQQVASRLQKYRSFIRKVEEEIDEIDEIYRSFQTRFDSIPNVHSCQQTQIHGLQQTSVPFGTEQVTTDIHGGNYSHHNGYLGGNSGHQTGTYTGFQINENGFSFGVVNTSAPVPQSPVGNGYNNVFDHNSRRNTGPVIHDPTRYSGWSGTSLTPPNMMTGTPTMVGERSSYHSTHTGFQLANNGVSNASNLIPEASVNNQHHAGFNLDSSRSSMWMAHEWPVPDPGVPAPETHQTMPSVDEQLRENEQVLQMLQGDDQLLSMIGLQDDATEYVPEFQASTAQTMDAAGSSTFQATGVHELERNINDEEFISWLN
ncbi:two-component response regulator ARR10-like [Aristolochia californica]|uniref:two-component response regulator ARR10-like n=1 Tax=Aristolochia californica TaxID=171875 RepID=UPI0035D55003